MGLYWNSTQTLKMKSLRKLKNRSNQEIISLQLALFQCQQRSEPLPVFLSAWLKHSNVNPKLPPALKEFDSIFSKESFNALPESKKWDHAVKLIPGEKASNCKVYPLAPTEQKKGARSIPQGKLGNR